MTDHDALVRAICNHPDDDTPRLIYADFLEENGEPARAEFVRSQVELARTPDWEPFAVLCRTRKLEWSERGEPFRESLPILPANAGVEWHDQAFRRGLGWRVDVRSLHTWNAIAPRLYEVAPVGELYLNPPATRDDWQAFAAGDWVKHFRVIHLDGTSPVEAIRALCANPAACGITDIHFHRSSSPGLPELVEDLLATPLGTGLKGLHFSVGYQTLDYLIDALAESKAKLDRLSFHTMGLTENRLSRLLQAPITAVLKELHLSNNRLPEDYENDVDDHPEWPGHLPETLHTLRIENGFLSLGDLEGLVTGTSRLNLKVLDLSRAYSLGASDLFQSDYLRSVNVLAMRECQLLPEAWRWLVQSEIWMNLTFVDLRGNPIGDAAFRRLVAAPMPTNLTLILIDRPRDAGHAEALREKYRERICFASSE